MNYEKIYADFITERRHGEKLLRELDQVVERHHILPRSLGGDDSPENLIDLIPEDHYFAHLCLAKIHGGTQWATVHLMSTHPSRQRIQSRYWYGCAKRKVRKAMVGKGNWMFGRKHTETTRAKLRGRKISKETKAKLSTAMVGRKLSKETLTKMSLAHLGHEVSEQTRRRMSFLTSGSKNPMFGHKHSKETRTKLSLAHLGRKVTLETRIKLSRSNHWSAERRRKASLARLGFKYTEEAKAKMSCSALNRRKKEIRA